MSDPDRVSGVREGSAVPARGARAAFGGGADGASACHRSTTVRALAARAGARMGRRSLPCLLALLIAACGEERAPSVAAPVPGSPAVAFAARLEQPWSVELPGRSSSPSEPEWWYQVSGLNRRSIEFRLDGSFERFWYAAELWHGVVREVVPRRVVGTYVVLAGEVSLRGTWSDPEEPSTSPFTADGRLIGSPGEPGLALLMDSRLFTAPDVEATERPLDRASACGEYVQDEVLLWEDGEQGDIRVGRKLVGFAYSTLYVFDPSPATSLGQYQWHQVKETLIDGTWQGAVETRHAGSWEVVQGALSLLPQRIRPGADARVAQAVTLRLHGVGAGRTLRSADGRVWRPSGPWDR